MKRITVVCFLFVHVSLLGQLVDDFSDGNLSNNPIWEGDISQFIIENDTLRSQGLAETNTIYLSTPSTAINETSWEFLVKLDFAPSTSNQVRIYLVSEQANLKGDLNGYFIEIGQSGDDAIKFRRQSGGSSTTIFTGSSILTGNILARIKVVRDDIGSWEVLSDLTGEKNFVSEGDAFVENTFTTSNHFGLVCKHTSTRRNGFFFDDFVITIKPDTDPPKISNVKVVSFNEIDILFNETVDKTTTELAENYFLDRGIGKPSSANLDQLDNALVHLSFANSFTNNSTYEVKINDVADLNGNSIITEIKSFNVLITEMAEKGDVIINELMIDPSPSQDLPEVEYVELYNNSAKFLDLKGYTLNDEVIGTVELVLAPEEYVILCSNDDIDLFTTYGNVIGLSSWDVLSNSGELVTLRDSQENVINQVNYNDSWYNSSEKREGGWSLELIDPDSKCGEESNWSASIDDDGGTPGEVNSIFGSKPDLMGPILLSANAISPDSLIISFNEKLDTITFPSVVYEFDLELLIDHAVLDDDLRTIILVFSTSIEPSQSYQLEISQLRDCSGNLIANHSVITFVLSEDAEQGDLLINELLYNPNTADGDFVEIYNNSSKYIDLKGWILANGTDEAPESLKIISEEHLLILPQQYLILTEVSDIVASDYPKGVIENFVEISVLPSYPNDEQGVVLINPDSLILDYFPYNNDMQHALLDDDRGVSLERISFDSPTVDSNNWHSASKSEGFATPGYINSQALGSLVNTKNRVIVSPEVFLPNHSGQNDFTTINYSFDQPGFIANISILDISGRLINNIAQNELLATEGFFQWNGIMENGRKARAGAYIVLFKVFDLSGNQQTHKKRVVIAAQL